VPKPVEIGGLQIDDKLYALVRDEIALGTGIEPDVFWVGLSKIVHDLGPTNRALLDERDRLQRRIDSWCLSHRGQLHHGIVTEWQVRTTFERMVAIVDGQNRSDPNCRTMTPRFDNSVAFQAALDLVFNGRAAENGYTEPVLHARRRQVKDKAGRC
jgi:malate synthase